MHEVNVALRFYSFERCDLLDCLQRLSRDFNVESLLVEGGATILQSVLEQRVADQAVVTIRPCFFGGYNSLIRSILLKYFEIIAL